MGTLHILPSALTHCIHTNTHTHIHTLCLWAGRTYSGHHLWVILWSQLMYCTVDTYKTLCLMLMAAACIKSPKWKTMLVLVIWNVIQSVHCTSFHTPPPSQSNMLPFLSPAYRGRGVVVGFLKVGYKKLFLLVSYPLFKLFQHTSLIDRASFDSCSGMLLYFPPAGPTRCAHRGRAIVCFGFLHSREPSATWLWAGAIWIHAAGEGFLALRLITLLSAVQCSAVDSYVSATFPGSSL